MANDTTPNAENSDEATKRKRRVLRPAAEPTTLREQSEQAQARSLKPKRFLRVRRASTAPFRFIGRVFKPLGRFRLIRVIGLILFPPYFRNSWRELRLVAWPNSRETRRLVLAVVIFSLTFGAIVAGVDWGFDRAFRTFILNK